MDYRIKGIECAMFPHYLNLLLSKSLRFFVFDTTWLNEHCLTLRARAPYQQNVCSTLFMDLKIKRSSS